MTIFILLIALAAVIGLLVWAWKADNKSLEKNLAEIEAQEKAFLLEQDKIGPVYLRAELQEEVKFEESAEVNAHCFDALATLAGHRALYKIPKYENAINLRKNFFEQGFFLTKDGRAIPMCQIKEVTIVGAK